jgi:hypothetical protein
VKEKETGRREREREKEEKKDDYRCLNSLRFEKYDSQTL